MVGEHLSYDAMRQLRNVWPRPHVIRYLYLCLLRRVRAHDRRNNRRRPAMCARTRVSKRKKTSQEVHRVHAPYVCLARQLARVNELAR